MITTTPRDAEAEAKLWSLLDDFKTVMLTTAEGDELRSRPMHLNVDRDEGCLWFITRGTAPKVGEVAATHSVNLACADAGTQRYVSVSGRAAIVDDRERLKALWNPFIAVWFDKGPDEADAALIRVSVDRAEFWDGKTNKLVQTWELLKARITGGQPDLADHRRIG